jgi:nitroreductase
MKMRENVSELVKKSQMTEEDITRTMLGGSFMRYKQLVETIPLRHSVRTYLPQPLPEEAPEKLREFFDELSVPFEHDVKLRIFQAEPGRKLYNNAVNPVDNIAFISQTDLLSVSKVGFAGQLVMLYAVSLGYDTCWFGHYKLSEVGKYIPDIASADRLKQSSMGYGYGRHVDVGERVICCMPFGRKADDSKRLVDYVGRKFMTKRKPLAELLEKPGLAGSIPGDITEALELARLAPSASNSQMWRFGVSDDFGVITVAKPAGYKHFKWEHPDVDIGICAAHLWLGLLEKGREPRVEVNIDADRALWSFHIG